MLFKGGSYNLKRINKENKMVYVWITLLLMTSLITTITTGSAEEGLLGTYDDLYGSPMPSPEYVIGREADVRNDGYDSGFLLGWKPAFDSDYLSFSLYLDANKCELTSWDLVDGVLTCVITKNEKSITVNYDRLNAAISVIYPQGTRAESTKGVQPTYESGILPTIAQVFEEIPLVVQMPNIENALNRSADVKNANTDGSIQMTFSGIDEKEFNTCSRYLGNAGCTVRERVHVGDATSFILEKEGKTFTFVYNSETKTIIANYPAGIEVKQHIPIQKGGYVKFGHYEQDNITSNGKEPIEWLVLSVVNGKAFLISRYGLDAKPYHTSKATVTWETCSLRVWLNGEFFNAAFTKEEQEAIDITIVHDKSGRPTDDKIFLLNSSQASWYFDAQSIFILGSNKNVNARTSPTAYAISQGVETDNEYMTKDGLAACWWWLCNPNTTRQTAEDIEKNGSIASKFVNLAFGAVRPALYLDLESGIF